MEVLVKAAQLILSLSILVVVHEFGHFLFAKLFKTRVEKFYLFWNPWFSLFKKKIGETEYGIGWLPLGGYVKIAGMIDESMDKEQMKKPPQSWEFRSKPAWQRLLIMVGGVLFNLILALIIYSGTLYYWGESYLPTKNVKYGIVVNETGRQLGLENGDKIISVGGNEVENFARIIPIILLDDPGFITVERQGKQMDLPITSDHVAAIIKDKKGNVISFRFPFEVAAFPKKSPGKEAGLEVGDQLMALNGDTLTFFDQYVNSFAGLKGQTVTLTVNRQGKYEDLKVPVSQDGKIGVGVRSPMDFFELATFKYGFLEAIPAGAAKGFTTMKDYLKQLKLLFSPKTKAYESVGGFISIGKIFPGVWNWHAFWSLTAFLSIILAVMNILPIPALDGGHVITLLYEMITGRPPSEKFLEYSQIVGMIILLSLLLFANLNDVLKLFQ